MQKSYLVIAIALVVFVSGCAQADLVKKSFEKAEALEKGAGYTTDYNLALSISFNDAFKEYAKKDPQTASGLSALQNAKFNLKLSDSIANNGNNRKIVLDLSDAAAAMALANPSLAANSPKKQVVSQYKAGSELTTCVEFDEAYLTSQGSDLSGPICIKGNEKELSKIGLGSIAQSFNQYSSNLPSSTLEILQSLYGKGLLTVGNIKDESIIGRSCKSVAFSVNDMTKLSDEELIKLIGGGATASGAPTENLAQAATILKSLLKKFSEELCFDSEHGVPLRNTAEVTTDLSSVIKFSAQQSKSLVPADKQAEFENKLKEIPDNLQMVTSMFAEATVFRTPPLPSDYTIPSEIKVMTADEAKSRLPGLGEA